jgi:ParB-like chromosome segregation protein Spo0J
VKLLKSLSVRISSLNLPSARAKLDLENVEGLTAELQAGRLLPPIRIDSGRYVIQGFHRLAAHQAVGAKEIRADIVEYDSPEEREVDVLAENLRRRQLPHEEYRAGLRRMVELFEATPSDRQAIEDQLDAEMGGGPGDVEASRNFSSPDDQLPAEPAKQPGRPSSPKRAAIKKTAALTGASESTVERAVKPKAKERGKDDVAMEEDDDGNAIYLDWFDTPPVGDVDVRARRVQVQIEDVDKDLRAARKKITGLRDLGHPNALCDAIEEAYTTLAHLVRRSRPQTACHACKGQSGANCFDCQGTGYATIAQAEGDVPKELLERGDRAMVRNGRGGFRSLVADKPEPYKPISPSEAETPPGDPSTPYEPTAGEIVVVRWNPQGDVKKARFVRFTKSGRSMIVQVARVDRKGKTTGEWGDDRTFDRSELMGPAEGLPF